MKYVVVYIGAKETPEKGIIVTKGDETREQIDEVKRLYSATPALNSWEDVDHPDEERTLFRAIEHDRRKREKHLMADRPPAAVLWFMGNELHRLEYYEGHDYLQKVHDVRAASYTGPNKDSLGD